MLHPALVACLLLVLTWTWPSSAKADATYEFGQGGFITQFDGIGPLKARELRRKWPKGRNLKATSKKLWNHVGQAGPVLEFGTHRTKRGVILRGTLVSRQAQNVWLRVGLTGKLDALVNGKRVLQLEDEDYLLIDDHEVNVALQAGKNEILFRLESTPRLPLRLVARWRTKDEQAPVGISWSTLTTPTDPCSLVRAELRRKLTGAGWRSLLEARLDGLRPASPKTVIWLSEAGGERMSADLGAKTMFVSLAPAQRQGARSSLAWGIGEATCGHDDFEVHPLLDARLIKLRAQCHPPQKESLTSAGDQASIDYTLKRLEKALGSNNRRDWIESQLSKLETVCHTNTEKGGYARVTGIITRAYTSALDGRYQPYVLYVPDAYVEDMDRSFPLVVAFHGLGFSPEETLRITLGQATRAGDFAPGHRKKALRPRRVKALVLAVSAYGSVGHRTLGELDVLRAIEEVRSHYRVDERRISITGFSLGGTAAFVLPLHTPSLFSAAAPICGYPNLRQFFAVKFKKKKPWERILLRQRAIVEYAENGLHIPMHIVHGGRDKPERSQLMVDRFVALGQRPRFDLYPELGHNVWNRAYKDGSLLRSMLRRRRPVDPKRVRLRTGHLRFNRSHWLQLDGMEDLSVNAEIEGWRRGRSYRIKTRNVREFTLAAPEAVTAISVDGKHIELGTHHFGPIRLTRVGHRWQSAVKRASTARKVHGLSGPLDDIWYGAFIIVVGTQDPLQTDANRLAAEELRRYNVRTSVSVPVIDDVDVSDATLRSRSVMLVGNPRSNLMTRRAINSLPVAFDEAGLTFGGKRWEGRDVGISMIFPSPFGPSHYLVLHAGVTRVGTLSARNLPQLVPDYLVYDIGMRAQYGAKLLDRRKVLTAGFFDRNWSLGE